MKIKSRQFKQVEADGSEADLELLISTDALDKEGDIVEQDFSTNGNVPFLWQHGKEASIPPLGHVTELRTVPVSELDVSVSEGATKATIAAIDIDKDDRFAAGVLRKYRRGDMEDSSVGFDPGTTEEMDEREAGRFRFIDNALEELSATPVGANQDTTFLKEIDDDAIPDALKEGRRNAERDHKALGHAKDMIRFVRGEIEEGAIGACPFKGTHPDGEEMDVDTAIEKALSEADRTELSGVLEAKITRAEKMVGVLEDADVLTRRTARRLVDMLEKDRRANKIIHTVLAENYDLDDERDADPPRRGTTPDETKTVTDFQDFPLADRDEEWNGSEAVDTMREAAGLDAGQPVTEADSLEPLRLGHMWVADEPETMDDFKLPYAEVRDGSHLVIPRGIIAVAAVLEGARGGADIPEGDMDAVRGHVEKYYAKMREEFEDFDQMAPWKAEESGEPQGQKTQDRSGDLPWTEDEFFGDASETAENSEVPTELTTLFD